MSNVIVIEKVEMLNGFRVTTKKPELTESEYKETESLIIKDIIKNLKNLTVEL
jgi:hypothetical protein